MRFANKSPILKGIGVKMGKFPYLYYVISECYFQASQWDVHIITEVVYKTVSRSKASLQEFRNNLFYLPLDWANIIVINYVVNCLHVFLLEVTRPLLVLA
jgi:hypothetical protein